MQGVGNGTPCVGFVISKRSVAESFSTAVVVDPGLCCPVASAATRAVLRAIDDEGLAENSTFRGNQFSKRCRALCRKYPGTYKEVRGSGLFKGLEIAGDTCAKRKQLARALHNQLKDEHRIIVGMLVGKRNTGPVFGMPARTLVVWSCLHAWVRWYPTSSCICWLRKLDRY